MKHVVKNETHVIIYQFDDSEFAEITDNGMITNNLHALDVRADTHTLLMHVDKIVDFLGGCYAYQSGVVVCTDPDRVRSWRASSINTVTMRQARLALLGFGLLAAADAAIAAMTGVEGEAARIEWEYAHEVRRDAALVTGMAAALSLTDAQLDDLFITAAGL